MALHRLDHYNIETVLPEETVAFYTEVLGLKNAPERRPPIAQPGTWILVDDHPIVLQGLQQLFARHDDFDVVACCADAEAALEAARVHHPEVVVTCDPNGVKIEINIRGE